jgi:hypothetical protein
MDLAFQVNLVVDGVGCPLRFEKFVDNDRIRYAAKVEEPKVADAIKVAYAIIEHLKKPMGITALFCVQGDSKNGFCSIEITNDAMEHLNFLELLKNEALQQLARAA